MLECGIQQSGGEHEEAGRCIYTERKGDNWIQVEHIRQGLEITRAGMLDKRKMNHMNKQMTK